MKRNEIKVAAVVLALLAMVAVYLQHNQHKLGKPGLVLESGALTNEHGVKVADERVAVPANVAGYVSELVPVTQKEVEILPVDTTFGRRLYKTGDGFHAQVSAVLMKVDRTSIHKPHLCLGGQGWSIDKTETISIPMTRPRPYELQAQMLTLSGTQRVDGNKTIPVGGIFLYWFVADGQLTANHKEQMWWLARDLVTKGTLQRWAYISCFSVCPPGQEAALLQRMKRLVNDVVPSFQIPPGEDRQTAMLDISEPVR
jgi:hypothetical protein